MRLEHMAFNVSDPAGLAAWYVAHLDMRIVRSFAEPPYIHFLADSAGKSLIEIYCNPLGEFVPYAQYHPVTFHLAFAVADIEATRQRLLAAGARPAGEIDKTPAGDKLAFLRDPWGYTIQLVARKSPMLD